jgi:DNA polymerase-3 subunit delta
MDALAFLDTAAKAKRQPVYVLAGDEDFLKRRCRDAIITLAVGKGGDADFAVSTHAGDKLDFSTVQNDLDTPSFLAPVRVVFVEQADPFVTEHRESLERYVASPSKVGVLVLDVKTFPETTKLAKALSDAAKLNCKGFDYPKQKDRLFDWCVKWAKAGHGKKLGRDAAELLVELVGSGMGLLDMELAKLATAVGANAEITTDDVDRLVAQTGKANVFRILDAIAEGKPAEAFELLGRLLDAGDAPQEILGAMRAQLRKLANIGRLVASGQSLGPALDAAGIANWPVARQSAERQLKHLGRGRVAELTDWLVELDLGLKGGSPLPPRVQLELLLTKMAKPRA